MASGRFVSRGISHSEQLASVSLAAAFFFSWCIPHTDREGRLTGNPELLKSTVCPLRPEITAEMIPDLIEELGASTDHEGRPLVVWYAVGTTMVLFFPGFAEQQKGLRKDREAASKLPAPDHPKALPVKLARLPGAAPDSLRSNSGPTPAEEKLREGEVKETGAKAPEQRSEENLSKSEFNAGAAERIRRWPVVPSELGPELSIAKQWIADGLTHAEVLALIENAPLLQRTETPSLRIWHARKNRESFNSALGMVRKRIENERAKERRQQRGNVSDVLPRIAS